MCECRNCMYANYYYDYDRGGIEVFECINLSDVCPCDEEEEEY